MKENRVKVEVEGVVDVDYDWQPKQSANTLFRFFKRLRYLHQTLEKSAVIPRYYSETVEYLDIEYPHIAYPMICFCDINLHKMEEHVDFYGGYCIAFSKEWGIKNGIQPIQYVNRESILCKDFSKAFKYAIASDKEDDAQNYLLSQMLFLKPITGTMERYGKEVPRVFTDECEWRYIPDVNKLDLPQAVTEQDICTLPTLNKTLENSSESWLNFCYDDIKYLIIQNNDEFAETCALITSLIKDEDEKNRLISKIIVWENSRRDF